MFSPEMQAFLGTGIVVICLKRDGTLLSSSDLVCMYVVKMGACLHSISGKRGTSGKDQGPYQALNVFIAERRIKWRQREKFYRLVDSLLKPAVEYICQPVVGCDPSWEVVFCNWSDFVGLSTSTQGHWLKMCFQLLKSRAFWESWLPLVCFWLCCTVSLSPVNCLVILPFLIFPANGGGNAYIVTKTCIRWPANTDISKLCKNWWILCFQLPLRQCYLLCKYQKHTLLYQVMLTTSVKVSQCHKRWH